MNPTHAPGVEAASWAVAAHLAARLDDRFRLAEGHPGQQDILCFYDSDQPQSARDEVMLLVYGVGSIRVRRANGRGDDGIGGDNVWQALSAGRLGVSEIVQQIVDALGDAASPQPRRTPPVRPGVRDPRPGTRPSGPVRLAVALPLGGRRQLRLLLRE